MARGEPAPHHPVGGTVNIVRNDDSGVGRETVVIDRDIADAMT
jgi:hypothetical protein